MALFETSRDAATDRLLSGLDKGKKGSSASGSDSFRNSLIAGSEPDTTDMNCVFTFSGLPDSTISEDYFETLGKLADPTDGTILHPSLEFLSWLPGDRSTSKHVTLFSEKLLLGAEMEMIYEQPQEP